MNDHTIRLEEKKDYREVENLVRESFWNVYKPGCAEHYVILFWNSLFHITEFRQNNAEHIFEKSLK